MFIRDIGSYKFHIDSISIFTDDVQVNVRGLCQRCWAADENSLVVWILFDDSAFQDCFDHVDSLKSLFQGVPHSMALDEVVALTYTFPNGFDIHLFYFVVFSLYLLRLTR